MIKKLIALLLTLFIVVSMISCNDNNDDIGDGGKLPPASNTGEPIEGPRIPWD